MKEKLLSIVIPTFNRGNVIEYTLSLLHDQVVRNANEVELIVCDNASSDDTAEILNSILQKEPWFTYVHYVDHVNIDDSIRRSIVNAKGKFINLFGDDDVPFPYMVDTILNALKRNKNIGLLTFNAIQGYSDASLVLRDLKIKVNTFENYETFYTDSRLFTETFYGNMGFISVNVINREVWDKGLVNFNNEHEGYAFLTVMFSGAIGYDCMYLQTPLCYQRIVLRGGNEHEFTNVKLGIFQFVGIPRILKRLEELGAINSWRQCFMRYYPNQLENWYYAFVCGAADNPEEYSKYYNEIITYQSNRNRIKNTKKLFACAGKKGYIFAKIVFKITTNGWSYLFSYLRRLMKRLLNF